MLSQNVAEGLSDSVLVEADTETRCRHASRILSCLQPAFACLSAPPDLVRDCMVHCICWPAACVQCWVVHVDLSWWRAVSVALFYEMWCWALVLGLRWLHWPPLLGPASPELVYMFRRRTFDIIEFCPAACPSLLNCFLHESWNSLFLFSLPSSIQEDAFSVPFDGLLDLHIELHVLKCPQCAATNFGSRLRKCWIFLLCENGESLFAAWQMCCRSLVVLLLYGWK